MKAKFNELKTETGQHSYRHTGTQIHFWRTYDQQEIDLVEVDTQGGLKAFECRWQNKKRRHSLSAITHPPLIKYPSSGMFLETAQSR